MKLVNYNGWELPKEEYAGRYRNGSNVLEGLWKREFKNGMCEMMVIGHGHNLRKYKYPNIEIPFKHPAVSWENLFHCGGFSVRDDMGRTISTQEGILAAVIEGRKPIGFALIKNHEIENWIAAAEMYNLAYSVQDHFRFEDRKFVGFAPKKKVGELFALGLVWDSYVALQNCTDYTFVRESEMKQLFDLADKDLSFFLTDWDYANPSTVFELMKTGLLLGYAIESTFAILME